MKTINKKKRITKAELEKVVERNLSVRPPRKNYVDYLGTVNYMTNERVLGNIRKIANERPAEDIYLTVTSPGGPTGTAMMFYDHVRSLLKPNLITVGSGDVDSSGVIILLSASKRYVTKHTTCLLHLAGRTFPTGNRFTVSEMEAMLKEDKLKNEQYASVVAENSKGILTKDKVLELMQNDTVLTAEDLIRYGLADKILE